MGGARRSFCIVALVPVFPIYVERLDMADDGQLRLALCQPGAWLERVLSGGTAARAGKRRVGGGCNSVPANPFVADCADSGIGFDATGARAVPGAGVTGS